MGCFSCGIEFNTTQKGILSRYKAKHDRDGTVYWFYKVDGTNEVKITTSNGFSSFRKNNKALFDEKQVEFAHISEFGQDLNTDALGSNKDR